MEHAAPATAATIVRNIAGHTAAIGRPPEICRRRFAVMGVTEERIIGACLIAGGILFGFFGFCIFDNGLLALGNFLFLSGVRCWGQISRLVLIDGHRSRCASGCRGW